MENCSVVYRPQSAGGEAWEYGSHGRLERFLLTAPVSRTTVEIEGGRQVTRWWGLRHQLTNIGDGSTVLRDVVLAAKYEEITTLL